MLFNDTMLERMENVKADLAALRQMSSNKKLEAADHTNRTVEMEKRE